MITDKIKNFGCGYVVEEMGIMMDDLKMIWDEVISMLDLQLNQIQLKNWIMPLIPLSFEQNTLTIDATSAFIRSMVNKKYLNDIQKAMEYICNSPVKIILVDPGQRQYYEIKAAKSAERNFSSKQETSMLSQNENPPMTPQSDAIYENLSNNREEIHPSDKNSIAKRLEEKKKLLEQQHQSNGYKTLNPKYTIETFVRGKSNDFAYATATAVINNPGVIYNPLFIYGLSGLGKTHLMQAIAHEILRRDPAKKVLYITSENFMNEMIAVIENGTNAEKNNFRRKYRSIDVLLIDDIQFIAGKKATMEEVFHTFNDLKEANKQIVLSADKPPKELKNLEERLVTRFEGGMTADIQQPDFETRVAILNYKMKGEALTLPSYVIDLIAENITSNIRELEGALLRVLAYFRFKQVNPSETSPEEVLNIARDALRLEDKKDREISIEEIIARVTEYYHLQSNDLTSKTRQSKVAFPRQIAMYLGRKLTNLSLVAIGSAFSRDHTTVMHAIDRVDSRTREDASVRNDVQELENQLKHQ